ncbi:MAG: type III-B CRISPR module-associated Cmr3 family protein [Lachnospiraceae bacterium]
MKYYRVDFKPLEKYTLGNEKGTVYSENGKISRNSYYISSNLFPDQTTILGALRYVVLRENGLLNTDYSYGGKKNEVSDMIGNRSFCFLSDAVQNFGKIRSISPVFLWDGTEIYIRNPFCNTAKASYVPMEMRGPILTSKGEIHLPVDSEAGYKAKNGYAQGYISLSMKVRDDIFHKTVIVGNQIANDGGKAVEDGFYKREVVDMDDDFCFSVYLKADDDIFSKSDIAPSIVYLGQKGAAFSISFTETTEEDSNLEKKVEEAFRNSDACWYYALSDLFFRNDVKVGEFAIMEEKYVRNIETKLFGDETYMNKRGKKQRMNLIARGSVFYNEAPGLDVDQNCINIGYNSIVKLGGLK